MEENDYKKIDQHLQGELENDKQAAFKERLAKDKEFSAAYKMRQQMNNYLQASLKQPALEAKMAVLGDQYFKTEKSTEASIVKMPILRMGMAIAAALTLLFVLWNPFDSGDLYQEFAIHPPLALVEKSAALDRVEKAEVAYAAGQYERAYPILLEIEKTEPENIQVKLALGISALETGHMTKAQVVFKELGDGSSLYKTYGQWYLALSYIKQGENEKARPILASLGNDDPKLKKKAEELLLKLE